MSYGYGQGNYGGAYPPDNLYAPSSQPYAYPPSPAADDHPQPHFPPYSSQDYISPERDGAGVPGGRSATYPPEREDAESLKYGAMGGADGGGYGYVEKAGVPVTRGSIAAQVRLSLLPPPSFQGCTEPSLVANRWPPRDKSRRKRG